MVHPIPYDVGVQVGLPCGIVAGKEGEKRDILFFIDNIFRFTQAGSEVSALLGRMPSLNASP